MADDSAQPDQLNSVLRLNDGQMGTNGSFPTRVYHHEESMRPRTIYDPHTPASSVLLERAGIAIGDDEYGRFNDGIGNADAPDAAGGGRATQSTSVVQTALVVGVIVLIVALGIGLFLFFTNNDSKDKSPPFSDMMSAEQAFRQPAAVSRSDEWANVASPASTLPEPQGYAAEFAGVPIDDDPPAASDMTYYYPSPMPTPPTTASPPPSAVTAASERNEVDDYRKHQPPPGSWFGASAPTRGETSAELDVDATLNASGSVASIYDKNKGGNSVLGGAHRPPYGTIKDDAARHIGWAEMGECGAPESGAVSAAAAAEQPSQQHSMHELYQKGLADTKFRQGSSASTIVSPDDAASQSIGYNPDRSDQFAQGRAKAKQVSAEAAAAIGGIYDRKHKQAAGLSAAAAGQQQAHNDTNFDYFNVQTQQPFGDAVA